MKLMSRWLWCLFVAAACQPPGQPQPPPTLVQLLANEPALYPRHEDVAIESVRGLSNPIGVEFTLESELPGFSHFLFSVDGASPSQSSDHRVVVEFENRHTADVQSRTLSVVPVDADAKSPAARTVRLSFHPAESYAQNGRTATGGVVIESSEIPFVQSHVADWLIDSASSEDVAFARSTWGAIVDAESTPYNKARALAKAILEALDPRRGVPSDYMANAPPFDQFQRALTGGEHVWCDNFAKIFVRAAVAFGIPARTIEMTGRSMQMEGGMQLLVADGHTTTEIFDAEQNRWIWMDLTLSVLGAELAPAGPLHVAALQQALNDPATLGEVQVTVYDPATHKESRVSPLAPGLRNGLLGFFKKEQTYWYTRAPGL